MCEIDWFRMTKQQREKHIQKIANAKLQCEGGAEDEADNMQSSSLSITGISFW